MLARPLHVSKKGKTKQPTQKWLPCIWKRELSLAETSSALNAPTAQVSAIEVSGFKPTLKVCEHNRATYASHYI